MSKFKAGPLEAAKILSQLDLKSQKRLLEIIAEKDPKMAQFLKENTTTFNDLIFITPRMLSELLREISLKDLGLGLRLADNDLRNHILGNVSNSMRKELEEILLGPPQSVDKINESISKIMRIVRAKVEKGELVLKKDSNDVWV